MTAGKKNRALAGAWVLIALVLLLAPSPREWGPLGRRFSLEYDKIKDVLQPSVHFVLMIFCGLLLMRVFNKLPLARAAFLSVSIACALAIGLELLQALLPNYFARSCDPMDMLPSFAGALCGTFIGLLTRGRRATLNQ